MPSRIVREAINSSQRVNRLSPGAELLYRRLISVVDDYGRFYASPITVRGACWPTNPEKVGHTEVVAWLTECTIGPRPLIVLYEVDGAKYLLIDEFGQQQRSKSKFPPPPTQSVRELISDSQRAETEPDINLKTDCSQVEIILPATCEQNDRTSRIRISKSYAYSGTDAAAASKLGDQATEAERATRECAERIYGRHHKKSNLPLVPEALRKAQQFAPLAEIEECHSAWCDDASWTKDNGQYCPKLDIWLSDRGFTKWPPSHPRGRPTRKLNLYTPPAMEGGQSA